MVRGTAAAALMLAISGAGWHLAEVQLAFFVPAALGFPWPAQSITCCGPRGTRAPGRSVLLVVTLAALTFCAIFGVIFIPLVGIASGLAAGAIASVALERSPRARAVAR